MPYKAATDGAVDHKKHHRQAALTGSSFGVIRRKGCKTASGKREHPYTNQKANKQIRINAD